MTVIDFKRRDKKPAKPMLVEVFTHCSLDKIPEFLGTWSEAELLSRKPVSCGSRAGNKESYGAVSVLKKGILGSFGLRETVYIGVNKENFIRLRELNLTF